MSGDLSSVVGGTSTMMTEEEIYNVKSYDIGTIKIYDGFQHDTYELDLIDFAHWVLRHDWNECLGYACRVGADPLVTYLRQMYDHALIHVYRGDIAFGPFRYRGPKWLHDYTEMVDDIGPYIEITKRHMIPILKKVIFDNA